MIPISKLKTMKTLDVRRGVPVVERIVGRALQRIRERIMLRDEYTCQICGRVLVDGEVDHIMPLSLGGCETDINRQYICRDPCHREKSRREEKERGK